MRTVDMGQVSHLAGRHATAIEGSQRVARLKDALYMPAPEWACSSVVEHCVDIAGVASSILATPTIFLQLRQVVAFVGDRAPSLSHSQSRALRGAFTFSDVLNAGVPEFMAFSRKCYECFLAKARASHPDNVNARDNDSFRPKVAARLPDLYEAGVPFAFVAIGDNKLRQLKSEQLIQLGFQLPAAIGPNATVSPSAVIGSGVAIFGGAVINADAAIGDFAIINTNASIDQDCIIGKAAHVAPGCVLAGCVRIGETAPF